MMKSAKKLLAVLMVIMILGSLWAVNSSAVSISSSITLITSKEFHIGVVYDVNGGNQSSLTPEHYAQPHEIKVFPGGLIPVPPIYSVLGGATRPGYKFAGWRLIREDGSIGEILQPGEMFNGWGWWTLQAVWTLQFEEFIIRDIAIATRF
jgi:hypothetical protein